MPYRAHEHLDVACYRHPSAPAVSPCGRCMQPICEPCAVYVSTSLHCPACAGIVRRRRRVGRIAMLVVPVVLIVAAILFFRTHTTEMYLGPHAEALRAAKARVEQERCDRAATADYEQLLLDVRATRQVIVDKDDFIRRCGDWYRVHWISYTAYKTLGEMGNAAAEATKLIEHRPTDADYRWWRGIMYEEMGKLEEAATDYRDAIKLRPKLTNIPFNLADVLERQGKPCDAKEAIDAFLDQHPDAEDSSVTAQLDRLRSACGNAAPERPAPGPAPGPERRPAPRPDVR